MYHAVISSELLDCVNVVTIECCQLLDFGLARIVDSMMTGYVVTRWYRAPEVILNYEHYTEAGRCCLVRSCVSLQRSKAVCLSVCDSVC